MPQWVSGEAIRCDLEGPMISRQPQWIRKVNLSSTPVPQWGSRGAIRCDLERPLTRRQPHWIRKVNLNGTRLSHPSIFHLDLDILVLVPPGVPSVRFWFRPSVLGLDTCV